MSSGWSVAWSHKTEEIWFTAAKEGVVRVLHTVSLSGRLRPVARVAGPLTLHDIARDGRILVTQDNQQLGVSSLPPSETKERDLSLFDMSLAADLSADGKAVLIAEFGEGGGPNYGVYLRKTDGFSARPVG